MFILVEDGEQLLYHHTVFAKLKMTTNPRKSGFTFSSSGSEELIDLINAAAFLSGQNSISEFVRSAVREYISSSDSLNEEFKTQFAEVDLADQLARRSKANRFKTTRRRLELLALTQEQTQVQSG